MTRIPPCRICHQEPASYQWQPWGPNESALLFTRPGYHYRGFATLPVCGACKDQIEAGATQIFRYKNTWYTFCATEHTAPISISLWDGGTTVPLNGPGAPDATMICRDRPGGQDHDIVALVEDRALVSLLVRAPYLDAQRRVLCDIVQTALMALARYDAATAQQLQL
ncbi:MAG: hypothetical protein HC828_18495 [Blastochloris sp.]|nr:hypothetical protein [Blastochloris sp.]